MPPNSSTNHKRGKSFNVQGPFDVVAVVIATGLGLGFSPFAPGTCGSLLGVGISYGLIVLCGHNVLLLQNAILLASALTAALGIWAGTRAEKIFDRKDASQIVIDEVCGQTISFAFIAPYLERLGGHLFAALVVAFALFRLFDIFKPYPIDRLQDLTGGFGVMMDDIVAGIYAAALLSLLLWVWV